MSTELEERVKMALAEAGYPGVGVRQDGLTEEGDPRLCVGAGAPPEAKWRAFAAVGATRMCWSCWVLWRAAGYPKPKPEVFRCTHPVVLSEAPPVAAPSPRSGQEPPK